MTVDATVWEKLKAPFPPAEIEKLPKQVRAGDQDRGNCNPGSKYSADGTYCGKYHARSVHLDYVGHAGITMRLNDAAGPDNWSWEPAYREIAPDMAALIKAALEAGDTGLARTLLESCPPKTSDGGLWIRLTICGATKLGFGDAAGKTGPNAVKEVIGDALRNAAMRFGVGTYLWSKSDAAAALLAGDATDGGDTHPATHAGSDPMERQHARSAARKAVAAAGPVPRQGRQASTVPPVALKTAMQAAACDDAATIRRVREWVTKQGHEAADIRSAVEVAANALKLPDGPLTLAAWLDECIRRVETEGLSVDDQVRVIAEEGVPA